MSAAVDGLFDTAEYATVADVDGLPVLEFEVAGGMRIALSPESHLIAWLEQQTLGGRFEGTITMRLLHRGDKIVLDADENPRSVRRGYAVKIEALRPS